MPEYSGPFPNQDDFSLDSWRRRFRGSRGHILGPRSTAGACSAGTGSTVNVTGLEASVDGVFYRSSLDPIPADVVIDAPLNASSSPRRNLVVLRLDPLAAPPTGGHTGAITLQTVQGTPAGSPVDPAPTQTDTGIFELPLYSYYMPGSASPQNPSSFTDLRTWEPTGERLDQEGLRTEYPLGPVVGGAWNGINPRRKVVFVENFTTNAAGNYYFSVSPQFNYGILEISVINSNPGFNGYFSVHRESPDTLLNQIGIQVRHHDGTLAANTFCGAIVTAVGW